MTIALIDALEKAGMSLKEIIALLLRQSAADLDKARSQITRKQPTNTCIKQVKD